MIWIGSRQQLAKVDVKEFQLLSANILFSTIVSNLGVHPDSQLTMQNHVAAHVPLPLVLLPAVDYLKFIDNIRRQDVSTGVCRRSA